MRSKLSYYSVLLLVGLAVTSGLVLVMNPFNSPPASASAPAQGAALAGALATNSTVTTSSTSTPGGNGLGGVLQPGGVVVGVHHHYDADDPFQGAGNSTVTTSRSIYSQHE